jgi:hypothetical protein
VPFEFQDWYRVRVPIVRDEASALRCKGRDGAVNAYRVGIRKTSRPNPGIF